jgi:membrane associated rhomboid family serine protease
MRYNTRTRYSSSLNWSLPPGVKWLIVANCAIFLLDFLISMSVGRVVSAPLALVPREVIRGQIWELVTYMFLHSLSSIFHIVFNMLALWMFGVAVEQTWGTQRFIRYYFVCGVGAAVCVVLVNLLFGNPYQRVIGASGAIYGVLLAFGMLFPDQTVLLGMFIPIKAKYMVMIYGAIAFLSSFQTESTVSNLAHLGGMIFGYVYIRTMFGRRLGLRLDLERRWKEYRLQRAKKKFQVYMKKQDSNRGPWVN